MEKAMTHTSYNFKKLIIAGGTTFALLAAPMAVTSVTGFNLGVISAAQAADDGGSSSKQSSGQKGKAGSQKGAQGKGDSASNKIFRMPEADEDSDRPVWAGVKGGKSGGGGKPVGAGSKKGDLFGDMVVLLRDANGEPLLTTDDLVQVIAYVYDDSGNLVPLKDVDGKLVVIPYVDGELATSINGVLVYPAEVDLGRLSVGRAPTKVLTHSLDEALSALTSGTVTLDDTGRLAVDGVTIDSPLENLALYDKYMTTGSLPGVTLPDGFNPASLLAAASDKYGSISVDTVVYMNSILGINTGTTYFDFSTTTYDRYTTWSDKTATVLVLKDGVYVPTLVNLYDAVFNSTNWTDPTAEGGADDFAAAADDYRAVIEFIHDNAVR
jgi:YD repeat-containing protein